MRALPSVIELPALVGARVLALAFLNEADAARKRVLNGEDDEALHDFRVALRRLRSCVRAYRPQLDTVRRRQRRWLKEVTQATNPMRDLEVQLVWLARRRELTAEQALGVGWLRSRLRQRMWGARAAALDAVRDRFPEGRDELQAALSEYRGSLDPERPSLPSSAPVAGAAAIVLADDLEAELASISSVEAEREAHDARITGKRLRYLLEPYALELTGGLTLIRRLRALQDHLGELRDLTVLAGRIEEEACALEAEDAANPDVHALRELRVHVLNERDTKFERLRSRWLERDARALLERVRQAGAELRAEGAAAPLEIERKYLLRSLPRMPAAESVRIDQGWLPGDQLVERVRRVRSENGARWYRTVKTGRGLRRREIEEETTQTIFNALWRLTRGRRVSKRRYRVRDGDLTWEIDRIYRGGPILAEVELPSADTAVQPPSWLKKHIVREVTGEPAYLNVNLAS